MENKYSDEMLDVGKLLILYDEKKLTVQQIKKETKASKVKKLGFNKGNDIDDYLCETIYDLYRNLNPRSLRSLSAYYIQGKNSTTAFLRLKTDSVYASVEWNPSTVKKLHNAIYTKERIDTARHHLAEFSQWNRIVSETLDKQKFGNSVKEYTDTIEKVKENYANNEYKECVQVIEDSIRSTW